MFCSCFLIEGDLTLLELLSHTDIRREGAPVKQINRSTNPPLKNYQRQTEESKEQSKDHGSTRTSPRHALKPPNGVPAQMNRDQESKDDLVPVVRIDTEPLPNGDVHGDSMDGHCVDASHGHIDRGQEYAEIKTEQELLVGNSMPEPKVRAFLCDSLISLLLVSLLM